MTIRNYRCRGYDADFSCDLEPETLLYCPICGIRGCPEPKEDETPCLCGRCGAEIPKKESRPCNACSAELCQTCEYDFGKCRACDEIKRPKEEASAADRAM